MVGGGELDDAQKTDEEAIGLPCVISDKVPIQCDITGNVKVAAGVLCEEFERVESHK